MLSFAYSDEHTSHCLSKKANWRVLVVITFDRIIDVVASEIKEFIFGMLFIKRISDEFDLKCELIRRQYKHLAPEQLKVFLERKTSYGETIFVPKRARWNASWVDECGQDVPPLKHLKHGTGNMLNKAFVAIEDENNVLGGVLKKQHGFKCGQR